MRIHRLNGCSPTPLAHYLKALGILRLVGEQLDAEARGWWEGERFVLATSKTEEELLEFFLERYEPTPLVSPWNKGSGFFANDKVFEPIEKSTANRFARLRAGVVAARAQLDALGAADRKVREVKAEAKGKELTKAQRESLRKSEAYRKRLAEAERLFRELKAGLIPDLRRAWRGPHREWMDAAMVLDAKGEARFPALLGTGGNDGRLDFTNNYFQRLSETFQFEDPSGRARPEAENWVRDALFGAPARSLVRSVPGGQFAPGVAGGANATTGPDGAARMNPFDFVLMLEGSVLFSATATCRWDSNAPARASAPFVVGGHSAGYSSASAVEDTPRGEQWLPLWASPVALSEVSRLFAEGRAQLGARGAREPLDLARAVARLGTARGIESFQRFGYVERNGQSNLAIPLGRFFVPPSASLRLACLDDLDILLPRVRRQARDAGAPARLAHAERRLADAVFAVTQHPDEPLRWQALLLRLADIEAIQNTGSGYAAGPIPRLRPEWVAASDDASPELRLAVALALQAGEFDRKTGKPLRDSGVRRHWVTLASPGRYATSGSGGQQRLLPGSDRVLEGRSGVDDAIALVMRRIVEAGQQGRGLLPLRAARRAGAHATDLARLVAGAVDVDRTLALARALMALDARAWARDPLRPSRPRAGDIPDDAWLAIRLATLPFPLASGVAVNVDPALARRLEGGDASGAVSIALRRLRAAGVRPAIEFGSVPALTARLWAAALAFPISTVTAERFLARLDPRSLKETA
jgi:CRISPR-associated protein Csx17